MVLIHGYLAPHDLGSTPLKNMSADGRIGWPHQFAPYDAIVGASAAAVPKPLIEQLKPGGRMVIPVGNFCRDLQVVDKREDGSVSMRMEALVRYVPLTNRGSRLLMLELGLLVNY